MCQRQLSKYRQYKVAMHWNYQSTLSKAFAKWLT
uniref:Uncharacterized protein n=1 Tax=Rhizophora mucronata TaxID=61149 RepID=A0A2P2R5B5_RHIMU